MATSFDNTQDRIAYMKLAFAKKQAEKAALAKSIRNDHCLLDAIGCMAWGGSDRSMNDGFYGEVEAHPTRTETESYMQVVGEEL